MSPACVDTLRRAQVELQDALSAGDDTRALACAMARDAALREVFRPDSGVAPNRKLSLARELRAQDAAGLPVLLERRDAMAAQLLRHQRGLDAARGYRAVEAETTLP